MQPTAPLCPVLIAALFMHMNTPPYTPSGSQREAHVLLSSSSDTGYKLKNKKSRSGRASRINEALSLSLSPDDRPLQLLKDCGPSAISIELSSLSSEGGGDNGLLVAFIHMIDSMLLSGRDFDLAHGYLALFLKVGQ